jgi:hypothetical protein
LTGDKRKKKGMVQPRGVARERTESVKSLSERESEATRARKKERGTGVGGKARRLSSERQREKKNGGERKDRKCGTINEREKMWGFGGRAKGKRERRERVGEWEINRGERVERGGNKMRRERIRKWRKIWIFCGRGFVAFGVEIRFLFISRY